MPNLPTQFTLPAVSLPSFSFGASGSSGNMTAANTSNSRLSSEASSGSQSPQSPAGGAGFTFSSPITTSAPSDTDPASPKVSDRCVIMWCNLHTSLSLSFTFNCLVMGRVQTVCLGWYVHYGIPVLIVSPGDELLHLGMHAFPVISYIFLMKYQVVKQ